MSMMCQWSTLLSTSRSRSIPLGYFLMMNVVLVMADMITGQAPGDEDKLCVTSLPDIGQNIVEDPPNGKILMDSNHYARLLPPNTNPVWQKVDLDGNTMTGLRTSWVEQNGPCDSLVTVCGWSAGDQNNWLITQHINRTINGHSLQQVSIMIEYEQFACPEETTVQNTRCKKNLELLRYETSTIDPVAARDTSNYNTRQTLVTQVSESSTCIITEHFGFSTNETGFYLALRDPGTCIVILRLVVFYYACPSEVVNLVVKPETIAPVVNSNAQLSVPATCVPNSSFVGVEDFILMCLERGNWIATSSGCQCNPGFVTTMNQECLACELGFYASQANGSCLTCPNNSNTIQSGLAMCPCNQGYYRTPQEVDLPCTFPPSPPLNVRVVNVTTTMVMLEWEEPVSTGGRSRDELRYNLWYRVQGDSQITLASTVNDTTGTVRGLSINIGYEVFVTSETNITSQISVTNISLLARGDSIVVSTTPTTLLLTDSTISTILGPSTIPPNSELIVAVVVSVLVIATATVIIVIVICVAVLCYRKSVSKLTVELTELRTIEHSDNNTIIKPITPYNHTSENSVVTKPNSAYRYMEGINDELDLDYEVVY